MRKKKVLKTNLKLQVKTHWFSGEDDIQHKEGFSYRLKAQSTAEKFMSEPPPYAPRSLLKHLKLETGERTPTHMLVCPELSLFNF